jgi:hypothetical protein
LRRVSRLVATTVLAGLAATATVLPPSAAAFTPVLRVIDGQIDPLSNGVAVDRRGDMFVAARQSFPDAPFDSTIGDKVEMRRPSGQRFGVIHGKVRPGSENYMRGQVAVTPNGRRVIIAGLYSNDGVSATPYVAEFSTATRNVIRGSTLGDTPSDLGPVAVDAAGRDMYVVATGALPIKGVIELRVDDLHRVRSFDLQRTGARPGSTVDSIAAGGPHGDVYVSVHPSGSSKSFIQVYSPEGRFVRQFFAGRDAGLAVNAVGWVFAGGPHGFDVFGPNGRLEGPEIVTPRRVVAEGFDGDGNLYALQETGDRAAFDIIKLRARRAETGMYGSGGPVFTTPELAFSFFSDDRLATFECRLLRHGYDPGPFAPCRPRYTGTQIYHNTPNGSYTFQVRAISRDGVIDPTPVSYHFTVQTAYAHARITSHPPPLTGDTSAAFAFTSSTVGATFQCRIVPFGQAAGPFSPCMSPVAYHGLAHNLYDFQVEAVTPDGYAEPLSAEYHFAVDPDPPLVSRPTIALALGQQLGATGAVPLSLAWAASDPNTPSAQITDSLQERSGPSADQLGPYATVAGAGGVGQPSAVVVASPGPTRYQFRGRAVNGLGVSGTGEDSAVVRASIIDQDAAAVTYAGGWGAAVSDAAAYDGTVTSSDATGATATLDFTGIRVGLVVATGPARGGLKVCLDPAPSSGNGGPCTHVDTSAGTATERALVYASDALDDGPHTIQVQTTSSMPVLLDGFVVLR